jgi:hypothetical protein
MKKIKDVNDNIIIKQYEAINLLKEIVKNKDFIIEELKLQLILNGVVDKLKEKEELTFEKWLKDNKYTCTDATYINNNGRVKGREFLWQKYIEQNESL